MSAAMQLTIATPAGLLVDRADIVAFRAEDATGSFGILPGHADFLTVLTPCVARWRGPGGEQRFCAVSEGVLRVTEGRHISIACRDGALGDALETLEAQARRAREARLDTARRARVEQTRLNARAIRQVLRYMRPDVRSPDGHADGADGADDHGKR